jgi:hypothetical protein
VTEPLFATPEPEPADVPEVEEPKPKRGKRKADVDGETKPARVEPPCTNCSSPCYGGRGGVCSYCFGIRERTAEGAIDGLIRAGTVTLQSDPEAVVDFACRIGDALMRRRARLAT